MLFGVASLGFKEDELELKDRGYDRETREIFSKLKKHFELNLVGSFMAT